MELGPVAQRNKEMIQDTISKLLEKGTYKNISDIREKNPSLQEFCFNNKVNCIMYSFSSTFTNDNYIELLKELDKEMEMNKQQEDKIQETEINGTMFTDLNNGENNVTLAGVNSVNHMENDKETFESERKFEKTEADFQNINDINTSDLSNEQKQDLNIIKSYAEQTDQTENTQVYFDENGNMTNIVKNDNSNGNGPKEYFTVDEIGGNKELVGHEDNTIKSTNIETPTKAKVKVLTKPGSSNLSAAFANTLILSFVIGSFFGIVFLAIYLKIMH